MRTIWMILALLMAAWGPAAAAQPANVDASGDWRGRVSVGAVTLRVALHLGATSTFDSPDQGVRGLPARFSASGRQVVVEIDGVGVFEGLLSVDGNVLEGAVRQGPMAVPLRFERGAFTALHRPQTPVSPVPYRAEEVSFENLRDAEIRLAGTLTLPEGRGPFPAVVLISGSGPQDRDGTVFEHKPYLVFADALTRRGVAVLRMDDRGVGGSSAGPPAATTSDYAGDVEAAIAWLRTNSHVDAARIGLLGHSEGAAIASLVASRDPTVGYVALLAGQGVSGREVVVEQARAIAVANGASAEQARQVASLQQAIMDAVIASPDGDGLRASLDAITARHRAPQLTDAAIGQITSPWYRHFLSLDPARALQAIRAPVLAVLGGKDVQVTPDQNAPALRAALADNRMASVEVLPGLNHLFQTAETGSPDEYGRIEETIAPAALTRVVDWIVDRAAAR